MNVREAVTDPHWQKFRASLKGLPTEEKLERLRIYYYEHSSAMEATKVDLQVDNYIKSLCRGGQLYPGESLVTVLDQYWQPAVKK